MQEGDKRAVDSHEPNVWGKHIEKAKLAELHNSDRGPERPSSLGLRIRDDKTDDKTKALYRRSKDCSTITDISSSNLPEVEITSLIEEAIPKYTLRQDFLTTFGGYQNEDWVLQTPILKDKGELELSPEQAKATLDYLVSCGDRLSQMTKTYHDVEAVTRLLEEKENDLELAAKIGQELLQRNKTLDERVKDLENQLSGANDLITQFKHELQVKTDLLHVYTDDLDDASPLELRSVNLEVLQKKIQNLEIDNRKLHDEASELAREAYACEEKEERLVNDTVKHLTEANFQIKDLHEQFYIKVDESSRQREEINGMLAQICDLQGKTKYYSHENDELTSNLRVYQETQDELTSELSDMKDKYREVVELLRDTQEELKKSKKKSYPGMGKHSVTGMFPASSARQDVSDDSLQSEIHSSLRSSKKSSRQESKFDSLEVSDGSDLEMLPRSGGTSAYRKTLRTYKAIARGSTLGSKSSRTSLFNKENDGEVTTFQSYTISRDNSTSTSPEPPEMLLLAGKTKPGDEWESDDSGTGRSTGFSGFGSLGSSAPTHEAAAGELLRQAKKAAHINNSSQFTSMTSTSSSASSQRPRSSVFPDLVDASTYQDGKKRVLSKQNSQAEFAALAGDPTKTPKRTRSRKVSECEVVEVQTFGELKAPSFQLSSHLLQATPLGCVPGQEEVKPGGHPGFGSIAEDAAGKPSTGGHPLLGMLPGRGVGQKPVNLHETKAHSEDADETEPMVAMTNNPQSRGHPGLGSIPGQRNEEFYAWGDFRQDGDMDETEALGDLTTNSTYPGLTRPLGGQQSMEGGPNDSSIISGGHPRLGSVSGTDSELGLVAGGHPGLDSVSGGHPGLGSVFGGQLGLVFSSGGHPSLGSIPGGHPGLGSIPGGHPGLGSSPGGHPGLGSIPGGHPGLGSSPSGHPGLGSIPGSHPGLGSIPGGHPGLGLFPGNNSISSSLLRDEGSHLSGSQSSSSHPGFGTIPTRSLGDNSVSLYPGGASWGEEVNFDETEPLENFSNLTSTNKTGRFGDSGVISEEFSSSSRFNGPPHFSIGAQDLDIDAMSDGGFSEMGTYPGIKVCDGVSEGSQEGSERQLQETLMNLKPSEVERRRKLMGRNYSYDLGSEGTGSPGSILWYGVDTGLSRDLPYGIRTPDSIMSTESKARGNLFSRNSSTAGWKLPEKLRIVKPIEGSLTLHHWSKLATPGLGGVLEDHVGVAVRGGTRAKNFDSLFDMYGIEDIDEEEEEDEKLNPVSRLREPTRTYNTITNSTVLHPDDTLITSAYGNTQMSSGFPSAANSRPQSRMSTRSHSVCEPAAYRPVSSTFSTNIGLAKILNERNIAGARKSQLDLTQSSYGNSLTPSVLTSPYSSSHNSPTETPTHTPEESLPGSPEETEDGVGGVYGFFSALKAAIYGEQKKQQRTQRRIQKLESKRQKLGIMEAVEEHGVDNLLERASTPGSLPALSRLSSVAPERSKSMGFEGFQHSDLSDFDARFLPALDDLGSSKSSTISANSSLQPRELSDFDELEDIGPGSLTLSSTARSATLPQNMMSQLCVPTAKPFIGQLHVPSFSSVGRPSLQKSDLGKIPTSPQGTQHLLPATGFGGRGPGRMLSPGEMRPYTSSGLGVPGHPGTHAVESALENRKIKRSDLGMVPKSGQSTEATTPVGMHESTSFIGSLTSMFFGRKGGYT